MTGRIAPASGLPLPRRGADSGITLIEVLVVLAVIGVATGATMLGLNATDRSTRAEAEAIRLARNLSLGVDEALISGTPLALMWDAGGYSFVAWSAADENWGPANGASLSTRHELRAPVAMTLQDAATPRPVLIAPSGTGPAVAFEFASTAANTSQSWLVAFDGFSATAQPTASP